MEILIVDPDVTGSRFLNFVFQVQGYNDLHLVNTAREALGEISATEFGLIVTEMVLPDMRGGEFCKVLRQRHYQGPIIAASENASVVDRVRVFESGADDFVAKPIDPSEFMARVAAVTSRFHYDELPQNGRTLRVGDAELSVNDMRLTIDGRLTVRLTPTEMRLMECLMRNADVAISRSTLVNRIWGFDVFGDSNRLDVYVRRLRQKIERDPTSPEYLLTVRSVGYAFHSRERSTDRIIESMPENWIRPFPLVEVESDQSIFQRAVDDNGLRLDEAEVSPLLDEVAG
jgi:two-component system response regulator RegX3